MKKRINRFGSLLAVLVLTFGLIGCEKDPEDVAIEFLGAVAAGNVDAAWDHLSDDSQAIFNEFGHGKDVLKAWAKEFKKTDFEFKVKNVTKDETSATVMVFEIVDGKVVSTDEIKLVSDQAGRWKIILTK